jgi:hypothetical protein
MQIVADHLQYPRMSTNPTSSSDLDNAIFPDEIWLNIIPHLAGDTPTLARCMRVSTGMHELAGPHLYRDIHWGEGLHTKLHPLDLHTDHVLPNTDNRLLKPKSDFFRYIRTFHIRDHTAAECKGPRVETVLEIPILRVSAVNDGNGNHPRDEFLHLSIVSAPCLAVQKLAPRKLILDGVETSLTTLPYKEIDQRSLATLVQIFDLDVAKQAEAAIGFQLSRDYMDNRGLPRAFHQSRVPAEDKRAIFVTRSIIPKDKSWFHGGLPDTGFKWLSAFCNGITISASQPDFPSDIIIVDFPSLANARLARWNREVIQLGRVGTRSK